MPFDDDMIRGKGDKPGGIEPRKGNGSKMMTRPPKKRMKARGKKR